MSDTWYMLADADPDRPMTPAEAAEWLRLREFGYAQPVATLERWASDGKIPYYKLGDAVMFTLRLLRRKVLAGSLRERRYATPTNPSPSQRVLDRAAKATKRQPAKLDLRRRRESLTLPRDAGTAGKDEGADPGAASMRIDDYRRSH